MELSDDSEPDSDAENSQDEKNTSIDATPKRKNRKGKKGIIYNFFLNNPNYWMNVNNYSMLLFVYRRRSVTSQAKEAADSNKDSINPG